uniref:Uncharacterized protein n=1 Tax=viral metagenome TaxID=1070528 RepID=A0A6H1ZF68_9ZZZZ
MLKIKELPTDDQAVLHHQYPGQSAPQGAYLELDCDEETLCAATNGEIGNAMPVPVWHCRVRRYDLPSGALPADVNALMLDLVPLLERVLAGYSCEWDGSNHVGHLSGDAANAEQEIEHYIDEACLPRLTVWDASDWWTANGTESAIEDLGVTEQTTVEELTARIEAEDYADNGPVIVEGVEEFAAWLIEQAAELRVNED